MNLQITFRFVIPLLLIGVADCLYSAAVPGSEPHGATTRTIDRSDWSSTNQNEYRIAKLVNEANDARFEGQYDLAIARCNTVLQLHPDKKITVAAYTIRSEAYAVKHQFQQSQSDAESAIRTDPSVAWGYIARGVSRYRMGNYKLAIADFDEAIRRDPKNPNGYLQRGTCYDLVGNSERAISDYTQAIKHNARKGDALYNRGLLFLQRHDYRAGESDLNMALRRAESGEPPLRPDALAAIAWLKATCPDATFRNGKKAVELATKACEISKWTMPYSIRALAAAYAECGDFDRAIKYETQAINTPDLDADATKNQKKSYAEAQRKELRLLQEHKPIRDDFKRPAL